MRLLYYSTAYFAAHGGSNHSKQFFKEAKRNPRVTEMLLFPPEPLTFPSGAEVKTRGVRSTLRKNPFLQTVFFHRRNKFYFEELVQFIRREKPDAMVIRLDSNFLQVGRLKKLFPSLIITTEINASPFDEAFRNIAFRSCFQRLERDALRKADFNFFVSDNLRRRILNGDLHPGRDLVVHNGVDPSVFRPMHRPEIRKAHGLNEHDRILGYIGTLDHHKRVDILLESFKQVLSHHQDARLLIVGDGPDLPALKEFSHKLGIDHTVTFTGKRPHADIPGYINCFDVAVHHRAGDYMSPLKIFEYMACGVPVVGPDTSAVREVFTDGKDLLLCNSTVPDLTSKIDTLLRNAEFRERIAAAGRELVTSKFTWRANADLIVSTINSKKGS